jgi:transposase-like protein
LITNKTRNNGAAAKAPSKPDQQDGDRVDGGAGNVESAAQSASQAVFSAVLPGRVPDPEVVATATRRRFTAEFKLRVLREADACTKPGEIGALLRREGIYSSLLTCWRRERERGEFVGLTPKKRGAKPTHDSRDLEIERLKRENAKLEERLRIAELICAAQKKVAQILGLTLAKPQDDGRPS